MKYAEAQIFERLGHLLRCHAEIVSGAYKHKKTQGGTKPYPELSSQAIEWVDLTDEEKLANAMGELRQHAKLLGELAEYIGEHQTKEPR